MEKPQPLHKSIWPALTLMAMAPLLTEVLPGATRFSSIFVFPIEMCVWGGGALLIRVAVLKWQLGWVNMLLLAIVLSIAEECIIQQTSLAPMVIRLKGITYARAMGVNYVYFVWALIYEPVFVVVLPVYLVELIFPARKQSTWINTAGLIVVCILFIIGSFLAWFSWTHVARPKIFHMSIYNPPLVTALIAAVVMAFFIFLALGPFKHKLTGSATPLKPFNPWVLGIGGAVWATALYFIVILGFGEYPNFPSMAAIAIGVLLVLIVVMLVPRFTVHILWQNNYQYGLIFGVMIGSMLIGFIGFMGSPNADLYFKIVTNVLAVGLMITLGLNIKQRLVNGH